MYQRIEDRLYLKQSEQYEKDYYQDEEDHKEMLLELNAQRALIGKPKINTPCEHPSQPFLHVFICTQWFIYIYIYI